MNITIENFKNLKQLNYTIDDNKINFLFGMSGLGFPSKLKILRHNTALLKKTRFEMMKN